MTHAKHLRSRGFTLVEILVVIGIIAALVGISLIALSKIGLNGREKVTQTRLAGLRAAITDFLADDTFNADLLPEETGDVFSSQELYKLLSGDADASGSIDNGEIKEASYFEKLIPPRKSNGKIDFTSSECMVRNFEQVNGEWVLVQEHEGELGANFAIIDAFQRPIRFWHRNGQGIKNNIDGGYDLWSAGQDGKTTDDPSATPTESNGMLDDVGL